MGIFTIWEEQSTDIVAMKNEDKTSELYVEPAKRCQQDYVSLPLFNSNSQGFSGDLDRCSHFF